MPPTPLAQELLDSIVDQVQERITLKACSLVASSFVVSSQRRLFRSVCLSLYGPGSRKQPEGTNHLTVSMTFQNALHLFTMSSHLGTYVRDLHLGLYPAFTSHYDVVETVLRITSSRITLLGIFGLDSFDWNSIPTSLTTLLTNIVLRPTVQSLCLEHIRGVPSSFILCPSFSVVSLYFISIEEDTDTTSTSPFIPSPPDPARSRDLEHLVVTPPPASTGHQGSPAIEMDMQGRLTGLRKLSLLYLPVSPDKRWKHFLLQSDVQQTLRHLELSFLVGSIPELGLPSFLALRTLEIGLAIANVGVGRILDSVLANIHTSAPVLECLSLTLKLWASGSWPHHCDPCPSFASLDFVNRLPRLGQVHFSLDLNGGPQTLGLGFKQFIGYKFPGPKEAGILTCSIT
ncbi:hypothetical protein C8R44DRAFT_760966 [Mycena epipterygia]|nr:hypothetical protein C8R44DRAFT_760966 [Mycena epipterygia]